MKKLLVSFSGGETSAYMAQWLWKHKRNEYDMKFVFANTGQENQETLDFVTRCSEYFGFPVVWIEANVYQGQRKSSGATVVTKDTASMNGEPFEAVIQKYGIPNNKNLHCTRELKERPIMNYCKGQGWKDWYTAIGIRVDEMDRVNAKHKEHKFIYPLVSEIPMTKPKINFWWDQQPFRLQLKGYQGNCKTCWKKSFLKLATIASENPHFFDFFKTMEDRYGEYVSPARLAKLLEKGNAPDFPIRFFRERKSVSDILDMGKSVSQGVVDDAALLESWDIDLLGGESCEVFSECGDD